MVESQFKKVKLSLKNANLSLRNANLVAEIAAVQSLQSEKEKMLMTLQLHVISQPGTKESIL